MSITGRWPILPADFSLWTVTLAESNSAARTPASSRTNARIVRTSGSPCETRGRLELIVRGAADFCPILGSCTGCADTYQCSECSISTCSDCRDSFSCNQTGCLFKVSYVSTSGTWLGQSVLFVSCIMLCHLCGVSYLCFLIFVVDILHCAFPGLRSLLQQRKYAQLL